MRNKGRQLEIDIAKGIAIICMVLVHTEEYFYDGSITVVNQIIEFLGSPFAAPVFMIALGVGVVYSRNNKAEDLAGRGIALLAMSYLYNLVVYALPYLILFFSTGKSEYMVTAATEFSNVDILQFAALAFLTFAMIKKLNWKTPQIVAYAVAMPLIGELAVNNITLEEGGLSYFLGLFWGTNEASFFPYCSWIIFPLAGYIFGTALSECRDKKAFYLSVAKVFIPVYIAMMVNAADAGIDFGQLTGEYQTSYYHMGLYGGVCLVGFALGWLSICYFASQYIPEGAVEYFKLLSRNITKIYVLQYLIIIYTYVFLAGEESVLGVVYTLALSAIIFKLADVGARAKISLPAVRVGQLSR